MYKIDFKKNKRYKLCSCGISNSLPFCDNEHRGYNEKNSTNFKSIKITPDCDVVVKVESKKWKSNEQ